MEPIDFFDRIKHLLKIVYNSPFFMIILGVIFFTFILLIINVKTNKKVVKIVTASIYGIIIVIALIKYWNELLTLGDTIMDKIFTVIYFPNYISYICMVVISIMLIVSVFVNKKISKFGKYVSILSFSFLLFLFVLTLETIITNDINITSKQSIYSSETLIILIQASTIIFSIWLVFYIIGLIVNRIDKRVSSEYKKEKTNEDIFNKLRVEQLDKYAIDDPEVMDEESFNKALQNYKKKFKIKELEEINK